MSDQTVIIEKNKTAAYRFLAAEAAVTVVTAVILFISIDVIAAYSAILGGLVFIVPNWLFTGIVFRQVTGDSARMILRRFFVGEAIKIFGTILLFAACFILVEPVNVISLFATFMVMMVINIIGLANLKTSDQPLATRKNITND